MSDEPIANEADEAEEEADDPAAEGTEEDVAEIDDDLDDAREAALELGKLFEQALPDQAVLLEQAKKLQASFIAIDSELSAGGELPIEWSGEEE